VRVGEKTDDADEDDDDEDEECNVSPKHSTMRAVHTDVAQSCGSSASAAVGSGMQWEIDSVSKALSSNNDGVMMLLVMLPDSSSSSSRTPLLDCGNNIRMQRRARESEAKHSQDGPLSVQQRDHARLMLRTVPFALSNKQIL